MGSFRLNWGIWDRGAGVNQKELKKKTTPRDDRVCSRRPSVSVGGGAGAAQTRMDPRCAGEVSGGHGSCPFCLASPLRPSKGDGQPRVLPLAQPRPRCCRGVPRTPPRTAHSCSSRGASPRHKSHLLHKASPGAGTRGTSNSSSTRARREGDSRCSRRPQEQHHLI